MAIILQQDSPTNAQATERQTQVQNYKIFSKLRKFYLDFFLNAAEYDGEFKRISQIFA